MNQVGPELGFHNDQSHGIEVAQKTFHRVGHIVRQVHMNDPVTQGRPDPFRSGGCHGGNDQRDLGVPFQQLLDQRLGGNEFAHRYRVNPQGLFLPGHTVLPEAFRNAFLVGRIFFGSLIQTVHKKRLSQIKNRTVDPT